MRKTPNRVLALRFCETTLELSGASASATLIIMKSHGQQSVPHLFVIAASKHVAAQQRWTDGIRLLVCMAASWSSELSGRDARMPIKEA